MIEIVIGTTPSLIFTFKTVNPFDLTRAVLTIQQLGRTIVERDLTSATLNSDSVSWTLTQEETLLFSASNDAEILVNWLDNNGTRGVSVKSRCKFIRNSINEVMS